MSLFDGFFSMAPQAGSTTAPVGSTDLWKGIGLLGAGMQDYGSGGKTNSLSMMMLQNAYKEAMAKKLAENVPPAVQTPPAPYQPSPSLLSMYPLWGGYR